MIGASSRSLVRALALGAVGGAIVVLAGCGAAAPANMGSPAKSVDSSPEPTTIEEAQARIAAARAELGGAPNGPPGSADSENRFAPAPPPPPPPPPVADSPAPAGGSTRKPSTMPTAPLESSTPGASRCESPCRALASMRRAVTALCRMTGNDDPRCLDAQRTLAESQGKIAPCSC